MSAPRVHGYEVVIGFETHAQLSTQSKIFSRASTAFGAEPNTQACAVDLALPGTLPVMNKGAVERAIQLGARRLQPSPVAGGGDRGAVPAPPHHHHNHRNHLLCKFGGG